MQFESPFLSVRAFFVLIDNKRSFIEESYLLSRINSYLSKHYQNGRQESALSGR